VQLVEPDLLAKEERTVTLAMLVLLERQVLLVVQDHVLSLLNQGQLDPLDPLVLRDKEGNRD